MPEQWKQLQERLLRAGVAPRHVRRYLAELKDHYNDLCAEEQQAGRTPSEAASIAYARLGSIDQLADAMEARPALRSWSARFPVLVFCIGPVIGIGAAYVLALLILWSGWNVYLPYSLTPFVRLRGVEIVWFGMGRLIYFTAPVLVGWAVTLIAIRQRLTFRWPAVALVGLALIGATAHVHVSRLGAGWRSNHVSLDFSMSEFHRMGVDPHTSQSLSAQILSPGVLHIGLLFAMAAMPYLASRAHSAVAR